LTQSLQTLRFSHITNWPQLIPVCHNYTLDWTVCP
jgi:hypothetical protein